MESPSRFLLIGFPQKELTSQAEKKVVKMIVTDLDTLGYHRVVFRSDNGPSILSLLRVVKLAWTDGVVQETSAEGDPQSSGAIESSVNVVKGQVRSIKLAEESASSVELPADHHLLTWLVPYAASMHRLFAVGRDGKTAHERNVGRHAVPALSECGGCLCSHPTTAWALSVHDLNMKGTWDRWMDRTRDFLAPQVEW